MDVSQVNTDLELAAILANVETKLLTSGLDPDQAKRLGDRATQIRNYILDEQKRHESTVEQRAREVRQLDIDIDNSPKSNRSL